MSYRLFTLAFAALAASACASSPIYDEATNQNDRTGYTDGAVEDGRRYVTFQGTPSMTQDTVTALGLLRAADITLEAGDDWFEAVGQLSERAREELQLLQIAYGREGNNLGRSPTPVPPGFVLEFITGADPQPTGNGRLIFDARTVKETVEEQYADFLS